MIKNVIRLGIVLAIFAQSFATVHAEELRAYKMPRTLIHPIKDTASDSQYELYIKLPESYSEKTNQRYPVIYFTDAVWTIEMLSSVTEFVMEDVILVGISWQTDIDEALKQEVGAHVSRFKDYSIRESDKPERQAKYQFGQARHHLRFIREDIIPYVDTRFRTDSDSRTYYGYSLGGEFGAYILLAQPDTFHNYIIGSPSLKGEIPVLKTISPGKSSATKLSPANVFVSYGSEEEELGQYARQFVALLRDNHSHSISLEHVVIDGTHSTAVPLTGARGISWLSGVTSKETK